MMLIFLIFLYFISANPFVHEYRNKNILRDLLDMSKNYFESSSTNFLAPSEKKIDIISISKKIIFLRFSKSTMLSDICFVG